MPLVFSTPSVADIAKRHEYDAHNEARRAERAAREYDPQLLKPVHLTPPPPMSEAERARLHSELLCLKRERDTTQEAIDHLLEKLAA